MPLPSPSGTAHPAALPLSPTPTHRGAALEEVSHLLRCCASVIGIDVEPCRGSGGPVAAVATADVHYDGVGCTAQCVCAARWAEWLRCTRHAPPWPCALRHAGSRQPTRRALNGWLWQRRNADKDHGGACLVQGAPCSDAVCGIPFWRKLLLTGAALRCCRSSHHT